MKPMAILAFVLLYLTGQPAYAEKIPNDFWDREWKVLSATQRSEALAGIKEFDALGIDKTQVRMDRQRMPWSASGHIYRTGGAWEPKNLFMYFLRYPDGTFVQLDGTSPPIHAFNAKYSPKLNQDTIGPYVWFFGFFVRGEEGPFMIVESPQDTFIPKNGDTIKGEWLEKYNSYNDIPEPMECRLSKDKKYTFRCDAIIYYSNAMFSADFGILEGGMVEMIDDTPIAADLSIKIDAPISQKETEASFTPHSPQDKGVEKVRGKIEAELFDMLKALAEGRTVRLNLTNTPFLAGLAGSMMEVCQLPSNRATRLKLAGFVASSTVGAMAGFDYSNPDLGKSIRSAGRQQALLASGALATRTMGCSPALETIGNNIAKIVAANSASNSGFVSSCTGHHSKQQCTCVANIGRQVIPSIAQRSYSRGLMREIIERNPFLALMMATTCGIGNY